MLNLIFREFEIIQSYKFACEPAGNGRFQVWKVSEVKADFKFMYYKKKSPKLHFIKFCYRNFVAVICEVGWGLGGGRERRLFLQNTRNHASKRSLRNCVPAKTGQLLRKTSKETAAKSTGLT